MEKRMSFSMLTKISKELEYIFLLLLCLVRYCWYYQTCCSKGCSKNIFIIHSLIKSSLSSQSSRHNKFQAVRAKEVNFLENVPTPPCVTCQMSCVICHTSHFIFQLSCVTFQVSFVTCQVSYVTFFWHSGGLVDGGSVTVTAYSV